MIGRITGTLLETQPPWLVVDVNGVGYEMEASMTTLVALPGAGERVSLYTHLTVRDDAHLLYAFAREQAEKLAAAGYTAFALDMYGSGKVADHPNELSSAAAPAIRNNEKWSGVCIGHNPQLGSADWVGAYRV